MEETSCPHRGRPARSSADKPDLPRVEIVSFFHGRRFRDHQYPDFPFVKICGRDHIIVFVDVRTGKTGAFDSCHIFLPAPCFYI